MADALRAFLPQHEGLLPLWLLVTSLASVFNTWKSYSTMFFSRRLFAGPVPYPNQNEEKPSIEISRAHPLHEHWPVPPYRTGPTITVNSPITPLGARTFGSWNLLSAVIRLYAAYHIDNKEVYQLVIWSYTISIVFVCSEVWVYGTARVRSGWFAIVAVGGPSLLWTVFGLYKGWYGS